jgi:hypothetical protein
MLTKSSEHAIRKRLKMKMAAEFTIYPNDILKSKVVTLPPDSLNRLSPERSEKRQK